MRKFRLAAVQGYTYMRNFRILSLCDWNVDRCGPAYSFLFPVSRSQSRHRPKTFLLSTYRYVLHQLTPCHPNELRGYYAFVNNSKTAILVARAASIVLLLRSLSPRLSFHHPLRKLHGRSDSQPLDWRSSKLAECRAPEGKQDFQHTFCNERQSDAARCKPDSSIS